MHLTETCRASALAARLITDIELSYMHMFIGLGWVCVTEFLTRDVPRLKSSGHWEQAREKEGQLNAMERCMDRLEATYPILREYMWSLRVLLVTYTVSRPPSGAAPGFEDLVAPS